MKSKLVIAVVVLTALLLGLSLLEIARGDMPNLNATGVVPQVPSRADQQATITPQYDWQLLRTVTTSDSALSSTTKAWDTIKAKFKPVTGGYNYVELACYADGDGTGTGDPNGGSFSYKVFVCVRNSSAKLVGTGTWAIGELALSDNPALGTETALTYGITDPNSSKWGELPVVTTDEHGGLLANGTTNDIGTLRFDARGAFGVYVEVTSLATCTNLYILCRGF